MEDDVDRTAAADEVNRSVGNYYDERGFKYVCDASYSM